MVSTPRRYDLYELGEPYPGGTSEFEIRACRVLPFVAVPAGAPAPAERIVATYLGWRPDRVNLLLGFDHLIAGRVDVINCSLGFAGTYDPADPIARATRAATDAGICVVVAAGNDGSRESLQELAQAPWVISVGATTATGEPLSSSSRGSPTSPGPTVVADGTIRFRPPFDIVVDIAGAQPGQEPEVKRLPTAEPGTSLATPRVSRAAAFLRKVLEASASILAASASGDPGARPNPVRLPVIGFLDSGYDPDFAPEPDDGPIRRRLLEQHQDEVRLDATDTESAWCGALYAKVPLPPLAVGVDAVRRALQMAAQSLPADPWVVGAGLITDDLCREFCTRLTPSRLLEVLVPDVIDGLAADAAADLDRLGSLWSDERVEILVDVFRTGQLLSVCRVA